MYDHTLNIYMSGYGERSIPNTLISCKIVVEKINWTYKQMNELIFEMIKRQYDSYCINFWSRLPE